jgi:hypothetical protein
MNIASRHEPEWSVLKTPWEASKLLGNLRRNLKADKNSTLLVGAVGPASAALPSAKRVTRGLVHFSANAAITSVTIRSSSPP